MRTFRSQLTLTAVAFLLGILVVVQLRAQNSTSSLSGRSVQDLTQLVALLNRGNDDLRTQLSIERGDLAQLQSDIAKGKSAATDTEDQLLRLRGWTGQEPLEGPGIRILLTGDLTGDAVEDLVNELWSLGADGVSVNGVRIVPGVVVFGSPHHLSVGSGPLTEPVEVMAIGDPDALAAGISRAGGVISEWPALYKNAGANVSRRDSVVLPATDRDLTPQFGHPQL